MWNTSLRSPGIMHACTKLVCLQIHTNKLFKLHPAMQTEFTNAQTIKGKFTTNLIMQA